LAKSLPEKGRSWSGNLNASLEREMAHVRPVIALELGSGEGAMPSG
jgi:hypothetical protein